MLLYLRKKKIVMQVNREILQYKLFNDVEKLRTNKSVILDLLHKQDILISTIIGI